MQISSAKRRLSVQPGANDVIRLTRSKAAVWAVDDVARLIEFYKKRILIN